MLRKIKIRWVNWIDWVNLTKKEKQDILEEYDFHELDIEACLEDYQRARVDSYDNYLFMVLHFPKFDVKTKVYELNEFNIFIWKDFLITFRDLSWNYLDELFSKYKDLEYDSDEKFKFSPAYILYEIIEWMLLKMFRVWDNLRRDIKNIEKEVFERIHPSLVKEIMIKKRNIIVLKNMFLPQKAVMKMIEFKINKLFFWEIEQYFEDLEDKLEQIVNDIKMLEEYTFSVEDTFKSLIDIKTNNVMRILAFFSAFMLPITFITSFYGMNIDYLPFSNKPLFIYSLLLLTLLSMFFIYLRMKKNDKF